MNKQGGFVASRGEAREEVKGLGAKAARLSFPDGQVPPRVKTKLCKHKI